MRFILAGALALIACKGKPDKHDPPANLQGSGGSSIAPVAGQGSDKVLHLPHGDGTLPKLTKTSPIDKDAIAKLRGLDFPGFTKEVRGDEDSFVLVLRTEDRPKLKVTTQIHPCKGGCVPIELAKWQARTDLEDLMSKELKASQDTKFQIGSTDLNSQPMIFTYQNGLLKTGEGTHFTDTYVLWFNDGKNEIRVIATYNDNIPDSVAAMLAMAPEADLENLAKAFMDVYTQAWSS
jgi:hypothetical protein